MSYNFGVGTMWVTRTDISNPTPGRLGTLQDAQVNFDFTLKALMGQYQAPVALGRGELKIECKAKFASISAAAMNAFFGQSSATGLVAVALDEAGAVPGSSTYTITVNHGSNWVSDLGVRYASTGLAFTRVASVAAVGQYSVSGGTYTFYSGDASANVLISYTYTAASGGTKITLANQLMGSGPQFQANLANTFMQNGVSKVVNLQLNACVSSKFSLPLKNTDWTIEEFDFQAMADASNNIGTISVTDA